MIKRKITCGNEWMRFCFCTVQTRPMFLQCPGGAFTPDIQTTKEFPDDVVTFVRNHPVMFNAIYPVGRRPLVVRTNADYKYTAVAVDQVMAADGNYQVLFLGTGTRSAVQIQKHFKYGFCTHVTKTIWLHSTGLSFLVLVLVFKKYLRQVSHAEYFR